MNIGLYLLVSKKIVHKQGYFKIHHPNEGEIIFLSMEQKIGLLQFSCTLHVFKYVVI